MQDILGKSKSNVGGRLDSTGFQVSYLKILLAFGMDNPQPTLVLEKALTAHHDV